MYVSRCFVLCVLLLLLVASGASAQDCPYSEADAVADTLDPKGYYQLEIGNVWEYVDYAGVFFIVSGEYNTNFRVGYGTEGDVLTLPGLKSYQMDAVVSLDIYGHSLGLLGGGIGADGNITLVYARVGGQEYGMPLDALFDIRVAAETLPPTLEAPHITAYPNPARTTVLISFVLPHPERVTLHITDVLGRRVARLAEDILFDRGRHEVQWDARDLAAGLYLASFLTEERRVTTHPLIITR